MRVISLDLGEKSLGICISDELGIIPIPVENFIFERNNFNIASQHIINLLIEYKNVDTILLGFPLRTDGKKSDATRNVELFNEILLDMLNRNQLSSVKVKKYDERFTTQRGIELLANKYKNKDEIKKYKDLASSYVMLLDYLNNN